MSEQEEEKSARSSYSLASLFCPFLLVALSIIGGQLGVASGFSTSLTSLTPHDQYFAIRWGFTLGFPPAFLAFIAFRRWLRLRTYATVTSAVIAVGIPYCLLTLLVRALASI